MKRFKAAVLPLLLGGGLILGGCGDYDEDTGPLQTETREVGEFDSIEMEGAARLEISVGSPESLSIEAREEVAQRVKTEVRGDTLYIRSKPKDWFISNGRPRVTLRITVPELASLKLEGGNDVRIEGFNGGESKIRAEGAVHIKARGRLDELTVSLAGAGHADLSDLIADEAKVTVDGVGSVYVHPKDSLDATMNGVGAILYTGSPREVNTHMNGLGTIGQRKADDRNRDDDDESEDEDQVIDPETLQPEYEEPKKTARSDATDVI
ncbi:MAG: head GIN domain-containing protein [Steroidobacter sp.]